MSDILITLYPWIKAAHIISVISWMAAMLYMPRLFINRLENESSIGPVFDGMALRLNKVIMTPAMIATWVFGILLLTIPGVVDFSSVWIWIKLICVLAMSACHGKFSAWRKQLVAGTCTIHAKTFRLINEIPTALMIIIVIMVVVRPF